MSSGTKGKHINIKISGSDGLNLKSFKIKDDMKRQENTELTSTKTK